MGKGTNDHERWTGRLSDFMDGGLSAAERAEMEDHLAQCGACRRVLEELREVKHRAAELGPVEPSRDLWAGIAATLQAPKGEDRKEARVIALPTAVAPETAERGGTSEGRSPTRRRFSFSPVELVAASLALVAVSSAVAWSAGAAMPGSGTPLATVEPADGVIAPVARTVEPPPELAQELAELEEAVVEARGVLDPNTIRILERNLGIIEQAIEDSQRALAQDPENDFLVEHLQRVYQRKVEYLRDAARVAERSS